jgi:hypothetical protein
MAHQFHVRLLRRPAPLPAIAGNAAGDDVLPVLAAALGDRHDMIERQLCGGQLLATVLTGVLVTRIDVGARKRHIIEPPLDLDATQQPDDRG